MTNFISLCLIVSFVILNASGACLYWYYEDEPNKYNPCGEDMDYVPNNAVPIFLD